MVTSVEPGIYIPGFGGIRIEDNVVIRQDGPLFLSTPRKPW
jgi:Xaa-Pro aminopeptidase